MDDGRARLHIRVTPPPEVDVEAAIEALRAHPLAPTGAALGRCETYLRHKAATQAAWWRLQTLSNLVGLAVLYGPMHAS